MSLLRSILKVSFITFFSRVLGFIRDTLIAKTFGADIASDAFFIAFKIPNLLRCIFAEGAFCQSFIPILIKYKKQHNSEKICMLISYTSGLLTLVLILIVLIGIIIAPWIVLIVAPGFISSLDKFLLTTNLLRILFPYILFISLTSLISSILNTWNNFSIPAFAPVLHNIIMITSILLTSILHKTILVLAWSAVLSGIFQLVYQLPLLKKYNVLVLPKLNLKNLGIKLIIKRMFPMFIGISINQLSIIINTMFASFLKSGSISWIYYADRLLEFPLGILGSTLNTVLLPSLSRNFINRKLNDYSNILDYGLRLCFIFAIPSAIFLSVLSYPLVVTLFQYGRFSGFYTLMTQEVLLTYSLGLIGFILVKILTISFYSCQDTKTPIRISLIILFITQVINSLLINKLEHIGLSLSVSLMSNLNAYLLYVNLRRKNIFKPEPGWLIFIIRLFLGGFMMTITLFGLLSIIPNNWETVGMFWRLVHLISLFIIGITSYFISIWLFGFRLHHLYLSKK